MIGDGAMAVNLTVGDLRALIREELAALTRAEDIVYLTRIEAAALLKVTPKTVLRLIHTSSLPAEKVGREWRLERAKVVAFLRNGKAA
jgi:excisionase family DNA binding protein